MQIQRLGWGVKGYRWLQGYGLRCGMETTEAKRRQRILKFWEKHGLSATQDAFGVSRRTLYNWKKRLVTEGGNIAALCDKSRAPRQRRHREWASDLVAEIRRLRTEHPNLGKEKIHVLLAPFCEARHLSCPSARTIGRLIADAPDKMRHSPSRIDSRGKPKRPRPPRNRKPKGFKAKFPAQCIALDTIEFHRDGMRRYLITLTDLHSRFALALACSTKSSKNACRLWKIAQTVLTDNGSEFAGAFSQTLQQDNIPHWHTYPRNPKMNAHCERFNRTLQDEFASFHDNLLFTNLPKYNEKLLQYLLFYNASRPHHSLSMLSPLQFISTSTQKCNMYWPSTTTGRLVPKRGTLPSTVTEPSPCRTPSPLTRWNSLKTLMARFLAKLSQDNVNEHEASLSASPSPLPHPHLSRPIRARFDLSALRHNFSVARAHAGDAKLWAVIKADAYGHGQFQAAYALDALADGFALLESGVAASLRERGHRQPILLLEGFFAAEEIASVVRYDLVPVIHCGEQLEMLAAAPRRPASVYLKINTGMNRLGFDADDTPAARERLESLGIRQITLMTHFAAADTGTGFAAQLERAEQAVATVGSELPRSFANSAALMSHPESLNTKNGNGSGKAGKSENWARPGIMLYGGSPFGATPGRTAAELGLRPVMTLESHLVAVRTVKTGERVGYGGTYRADRERRIGIVACGYADGYPRHAPTGAPVAVAGVIAPLVGRVSMDMLASDVSEIPDARVGSPVTLWGEGEGGRVDADVLAEAAGTISYELFCAVAPRVTRIYQT